MRAEKCAASRFERALGGHFAGLCLTQWRAPELRKMRLKARLPVELHSETGMNITFGRGSIMKKRFSLLLILLAVLALCAPALAEGGFTLDENATIAGMNYLPWARGYEPTSDGETMTVCLPLRSDSAAGKITATLTVDDETVSPLRGDGAKIDVLPDQNGLYAVRLSARLLSGRINGDYAAAVRVTGKGADGADVTADFPVVLRVRDGKPGGAAMRPALENVSADLRVGENGALTATLVNTDPYAEMRDILLTVSDESGDILSAGSDSLRLGSLMPGERAQVFYPLSVQPDAAVKAHTLNLTLTWTALGADMSWTEKRTLAVTQEIRLERGALQGAASVVAGDTAVLTLPLMNMGCGDVRNAARAVRAPERAGGHDRVRRIGAGAAVVCGGRRGGDIYGRFQRDGRGRMGQRERV